MKPETSSTSSSNGRRWPAAALLAAAIVILCEWALIYPNRDRLQEATNTLLEKKQQVLTSDAPADSIAILGTSRLYHLDPAEIESALDSPARVTNYSWAWSGVELYEAMLRALIHANRIPQVVIVNSLPELFGYRSDLLSIRDSDEAFSRFVKAVPLRAALETEAGLRDWDSLYETLESYLLPPSLVYRSGIVTALRSGTLPARPANYESVITHWQNHGWFQFGPENHVATTAEHEQFMNNAGPFALYNNTDARQAYKRFIDLAQRHSVEVIMVPVPDNPLLYDSFQTAGAYRQYNVWLDNLEHQYPNFTALKPRWLNWPEYMADPGHLNATGTSRHTSLVVDLLKEHLKADRRTP